MSYSSQRTDDVLGLTPASHVRPAAPTWPAGAIDRADLAINAGAILTATRLADALRWCGSAIGLPIPDASIEPDVSRWHDATDWPVRPLRIGFLDPAEWSDRIAAAPGGCDVELFTLPQTTNFDRACAPDRLDAAVRCVEGRVIEVVTAENAGRDAAWYDWSLDRPLSYPSVFPVRIDPARVTLAPVEGTCFDAGLTRALIEAAAALSRHPSRLTLADRVAGRRPSGASTFRPARARAYRPTIDLATASVRRVAALLASSSIDSAPTLTQRSAARLVGAAAATQPWLFEQTRLSGAMETAARVSAEEPETMLRLAAVRLAQLNDAGGLDAITRADRMLRDRELLSAVDPLTFLQSELKHGTPGPATLGRLAAGICMLGSTMPADRLSYFRDDLLDDLRFAELLLGRDQDRVVLFEVFRTLARARQQELFSLPEATPAAKVASPRKPRAKKAA